MTADCNPSAGAGSASEAIVRVTDAQPREFLGITFDLRATGDRLMVTRGPPSSRKVVSLSRPPRGQRHPGSPPVAHQF